MSSLILTTASKGKIPNDAIISNLDLALHSDNILLLRRQAP